MKKKQEISYDRYHNIAGEHTWQPAAHAYFKDSKVLVQAGTDIETVITNAKDKLENFNNS
jgi:hypothetical protein